MIRRVLLPSLVLAAAIAAGAELDLFVTDYNENPKADQKPLAARPVTYGNPQEVTIKTSDGKSVSYKAPGSVTVQRAAEGAVREARLFACPGEYEPFSFLLRPKQALEEVFIVASELKGEGGAVIPPENVVVTSVERFLGEGRDILMELGRKWNMAAQSTEYFWCTVHVPPDAKPGTYKGEVTVTAKEGAVGSIAIVLEVLPIALADPPFALGYNYSSPKDAKALAVHLADMRRHGMTCVAPLYNFHLPVHDADTKELGEFIAAYKRAGFPAPLFFATPMNLQLSELAGYGSETTKRWQQKYIKTMKLLHAEAQKGGIPVLFSIGDELTNKGIEGIKIAENLGRFVWEELPEIAATSDMNGYMEVMAMAPYLSVATFNNGWDGIDHHNKGRTLMNKAFITELQQKTGAIPWFVNAGTGRFPFGFFFWKMAKHGVRGKVEWYYNLRNERGSVVRTHEDIVYPTLDYERSREGIDDLKYVCKLESLVAAARKAGKAEDGQKAAEALLAKLAAGIQDDWSAYTSGGAKFPADGFDLLDPEKAAALGGFDALRRALADQILALQSALR
ncbi:MAG: hypothetical protein FJ290_01370 [Planctomycetes bacterium]|nr:hypothetical protein [Planctomycetota bacterium]